MRRKERSEKGSDAMPTFDLGKVVGPQGPQGATGPQGPQGIQGERGPQGADATVNGVNTLTLVAGDGIRLDQVGSEIILYSEAAAPTPESIGAVPITRTINKKALDTDITLTTADLGAVPTSRTVNGKALSQNISLSAQDVGARPDTWMPTAQQVGAAPAYTYGTEDLSAGSTELDTGKLHFVYE